MAFDTIKIGIQVLTRIGRRNGSVHSVIRHPVTRSILAVVIAPVGVVDPDEYIMTSARNLQAV